MNNEIIQNYNLVYSENVYVFLPLSFQLSFLLYLHPPKRKMGQDYLFL